MHEKAPEAGSVKAPDMKLPKIGPHGGLAEIPENWSPLSYDANEGVFVQKLTPMGVGWQRKEKPEENDLVIPCSVTECSEPAVILDRDWPMSNEENRCAKHYRK